MFDISSKIRLIIFDCDGTLVDTAQTHKDAWKSRFVSLIGDNDKLDYFIDYTKSFTSRGLIEEFNKVFKENLDYDEESKIHEDIVHQHILSYPPNIIREVVEVAYKYNNQAKIVVYSNSVLMNVKLNVKHCGIDHLVDRYITSDMDFPKKDKHTSFIKLADEYGLSVNECHVFEDGELCIENALRSGMSVTDVTKYISTKAA